MGELKIQTCGPNHSHFERVVKDPSKSFDSLYRSLKEGNAKTISNMLSKMEAEKFAKISQGICKDSKTGENRYAPGVVEEIRQFREQESSSDNVFINIILFGTGGSLSIFYFRELSSYIKERSSGKNSGKGGGGGYSARSSLVKPSESQDSAYRVRALKKQIAWRPEPFLPHQDTGWSLHIDAKDTLPVVAVGLTVVTLGAAAGLTAAGAGLLFAMA